eukprot:8059619-Alexandrium_andersonii.AAC.1
MPGVAPRSFTAARRRDLEECKLGAHEEGVGRARELAHVPARFRWSHGLEAEGRLLLGVADPALAVDPAAHLAVLRRK